MTLKTRRISLVCLVTGCMACGSPRTWAQSGQDQPTLDELLRITTPPPRQPDAPPVPPPDPPAAVRPDIEQDLSRRLNNQQLTDLYGQIVSEMGTAADQIDQQFDPGTNAQRLQQSVLDKLDQLIAAAKQQQSSPSGGSGSSSGSPQQQEVGTGHSGSPQQGGSSRAQATTPNTGQRGAPSGKSDTPDQTDRPMQELRDRWGNLPPQLRDQLLEGINERFSSVYRELTQKYYQRLAEQGDP